MLQVDPARSLAGTFQVPASKPETQRAILAGTLANGRSVVRNDLRCGETTTMKDACRSLGAGITERDGRLEIEGTGRAFRHGGRVIRAAGSGLVFRTVTALASAIPSPTVITGDASLRRRVMAPLFDALRQLGVDIEPIVNEGKAPVVNWGRGLRGGRCTLPGDVSSQFITAIMLAAPFADGPVDIEVTGPVYSRSYVQQTRASMTAAGVTVTASDDLRRIHVEPSEYQPQDVTVREDYTSASYPLAAATLFAGRTVLAGVHGDSMQGERAIVPIVERLGMTVTHDKDAATLTVDNPAGRPRGDIEIDASDCPNIVPTLAAIGAYVDGTMRVVRSPLTRLHKAPRIEAMAAELSKAGVAIRPLFDGGICEGFEVHGRETYPGGHTFSSWGDHRIFMSLFVAGLRMQAPSRYDGFRDARLSFPDFLEQFQRAGVQTSIIDNEDAARPAGDVLEATV
ncbi:MAG: 3-phosphoshikimate 1-carboxyvinyltransferase [Nocardiopsaceae bacterium]|nr:3-phosphoshikimate 1-carboxyvinyltransferase [Nocardiopsaceae bacterium]